MAKELCGYDFSSGMNQVKRLIRENGIRAKHKRRLISNIGPGNSANVCALNSGENQGGQRRMVTPNQSCLPAPGEPARLLNA